MKTGQVAKDMMKDPQTITAWVGAPEFRQWFSERARGEMGQRDINESEYDIQNTIRYLRNQNFTVADIAVKLNDGFRSSEPPPGLATRPSAMPATVYANQVSAVRENEELRQQNEAQAEEIARLNRELQATTERLMTEWRQSEQQLNREIGKLLATVDMLREQIAAVQGDKNAQ